MSIIRLAKQTSSETITIGEIREKIRLLHLVPKKGLLIENAHNMTVEAQNALLKTLEEPPLDAEIILETPDEDLLLPTIRSRCIVERTKFEKTPTETELPEFASISERLSHAKEKSANRESAKEYVENLLIASESDLNPRRIRSLFRAKKFLKANCNTRMVLENLFLNW